jgi:hypothetical protein
MKLASIGEVGAEMPAVLYDEKYCSLVSIAADIDAPFWDSGRACQAWQRWSKSEPFRRRRNGSVFDRH